MDNPTETSAHPQAGSREYAFFRRRHTGTVSMVLAVLLFLMPFAEFRCGDIPVMGNTGIGIAFGKDWKMASTWNEQELFRNNRKAGKTGTDMLKDSPNIFAIASLAAGLFGIAIAFTRLSWRSMAGMCAGLLAALMLLALMIQFRIELGREVSGADTIGKSGLDMSGLVGVHFTIWYYLSGVLFLAAAFLHYMRDKMALRDAMAAAVDFEFQRDKMIPGPLEQDK